MNSRLVGCWRFEKWKDHSEVSHLYFREDGSGGTVHLLSRFQGPDCWVRHPWVIRQDGEFEYLVWVANSTEPSRVWIRFLHDDEILFDQRFVDQDIQFHGRRVSPAECPQRLQDEIGFVG